MRVVVTGAAGRLGIKVCIELTSAGHEVTGIDRVACRLPGIRTRRLDLLDAGRTIAALAEAEAVVHLANHIQPKSVRGDPHFAENVAMNFNVLEAARLGQTRRLIFASSVQVMTGERRPLDPVVRGSLPWLPLDENHPAAPTNSYALSKALAEEMLRHLVRNTELAAVVLRLPMLLPQVPGQLAQPLQPHRIDEAFTWLTFADAARLVGAVLAAPLTGFRIYFPAAPQPWLPENVERLRQRYFPGVPVKNGTPLLSFVDCRAITRDTGWSPQDL
jgi:nucleoside-diphosphate-sugar epimerase